MSASSLAERALTPSMDHDSGNSTTDALKALARYIPAEGLALYIAISGFVQALPVASVLGLASGLVLNGVIAGLQWSVGRRSGDKAATVGRLILVLVVLGTLLCVYVCALPGNPLSADLRFGVPADRPPNGTILGGVVVIVLAAFMPVLGPLLKLNPSSE